MGGLLAKETRQSLSKSNAKGIKGNMKGDGMQTGGLLIVSQEGKVLFSHSQTSPGDHVPNVTILEALGIKDEGEGGETSAGGEASGGAKMECNEDACTLPAKK
ncbi:prostamide/prostaglandin F synthase-like [Actinia tenebrosa]|uniref:Prostamide/prostaglandin F synthase-like n=1 Tax=Actinia tenebrosa TaxID=6105 RepID=A0A6P8I6R0_ACTTE|nr:prostamide/prostaglandin F synthase-like [Actinia tenebrosa]